MELVKEIHDRYIREYTTEEFRLESDYKEDEQRKTDYHGRELLELLQNVDDAAVNAYLDVVDVRLEFKNNVFMVANNGTKFTAETIKRLCHGSASNKTDDFIGNKGTGFRSLLNWGKQIEIHSAGFHIAFSKEHADTEFKQILSNQIILEQRKNVPNISIPVLHCPFEANHFDNNYDTSIRIITDESMQGDEQNILNQLESFDYKTLIFLPNITKITIETEQYTRVVEKIVKHNGEIEIHFNNKIERYLYFQNTDEPIVNFEKYENRKIRTSVAISLDDEDYSENTMYSFFPIRNFPTQLNLLMHASFDLNTSRDDVPLNDINKQVLKHLLKFVVYIAENKLVSQKDTLLAIKTLTPIDKKSKVWVENGFNLFDYYLSLLKDCRVIPTVNEGFVAISDEPKLIISSFPNCFKGKHFPTLLQYMSVDKNTDLIETLAKYYSTDLKYIDKQLCKIIDEASYEWSIPEKIETLFWWGNEYNKSSVLPKLLLNSKNEFVKADETIYFVRGRELDIPKWAKVNQLDKDFEEELKNQFSQIDKVKKELDKEGILERIIARNSGRSENSWESMLLPQVKFRDADASTIISPINTSVGDSFENAKSYVKWLWGNYSQNEEWIPPAEIRFNLPSKIKTVEASNYLFLNENYYNPLGNKLFIEKSYIAFVEPKEVGINIEDIPKFQSFVEKLGVKKYPELVKQNISDNKFLNLYKVDYLTKMLPGNEVDERNPRVAEVSCFNIIGLKMILENLSIQDIILWIKSDSKLKDELDLRHQDWIKCYYDAKILASRSIKFGDYSQSYVKFIFENIKWFEISGEKYQPNQCVFAYSGMDISSVLPTVTNQLLKELAEKLSVKQKDLREFLEKVGVRSKITELDSNDFYGILLKLPILDQSGQISEKIYREVIELDKNTFEDSKNYKTFYERGKVFTQNHNGKSYHLASDSYFSNSIQVNVGNYHVMKTPLRNGSFDIFNSIFGVKRFKEKYEVVKESVQLHNDNDSFQDDFQDFIIYAKAWGEKNENIKKRIDNIKVKLVSQITLIDNGMSQDILTNYLLIRDENIWLIYLNKNNEIDRRQISKCIEEIFNQVANTTSEGIPNQLGELYRDCAGRRFLVEKYFGTVDVINQISQNSIRMNLSEVLGLDYDALELNKIDYNQFNSVNNAEPLIDLLKFMSMDIIQLNNAKFEYEIDLKPFFKQRAKNYIANHEEEYKQKLFNDYYSMDSSAQKSFYKQFLKFRNHIPKNDEIENSIYFDVELHIKKKFSIIEDVHSHEKVSSIYNKNFIKISRGMPEPEFADFIDRNYEMKSWIYFLDEEKSKFIKQYFEGIELKSDAVSEIAASNIEIDNVSLIKSKISLPKPQQQKVLNPSQQIPQTKTSIQRDNVTKSRNGKEAERIVRNKLKEIYSSLRWTSENSDIPDERNNSSIYDMEYLHEGNKVFVEVKAATNKFYMSIAEYNFAKSNSDNYELYLVNLINNCIDGPHRIEEFEESKRATEYQFSFET